MLVEHSAVIDQVAGAQYGLVTAQQAVKSLGRGRKQRWVNERRLVVIQPGVYRIAGAPQTWHQSVMAAALAADGIVSHRSAAELWGLIQPAGYVDVVVKPPRQPRLVPPAILHRVADLRPDLAVERGGMRLTDPVRTVVDLGLVLPHWSVRTALARGITTRLLGVNEVQALREALGRRGRNGTGVIQRVLDERLLTGGLEESELETRFHQLARRHDLPVMAIQHEVWSAGRFVARVDAAYPDRKVAIEVDGFSAHSSPDAFQRDRTRRTVSWRWAGPSCASPGRTSSGGPRWWRRPSVTPSRPPRSPDLCAHRHALRALAHTDRGGFRGGGGRGP